MKTNAYNEENDTAKEGLLDKYGKIFQSSRFGYNMEIFTNARLFRLKEESMALSHLRDWRDSIWFILSTITLLLSLSLAGVFWIFLLLSL